MLLHNQNYYQQASSLGHSYNSGLSIRDSVWLLERVSI